MSTQKTQTLRPTMPTFEEIDQLVRKARRERSKALRSAFKGLTEGRSDELGTTIPNGARA